MEKITVVGSGSWGTALAYLLCNNGHEVTLWSYSREESADIGSFKENKEFLPGVKLPDSLKTTYDPKASVEGAKVIVFAVPSKFVGATIENFKNFINENQIIVNVAKGFDEKSHKRLSQIIKEALPNNQVAVLSGPSHAEEVSRGLPTTCVAAAEDLALAQYVQSIFMSDVFRVYTNTDVIGVELGGAVKNVIALAAGISDGMGYGDNAKAAIMTRGMAEIIRLGVAMGGQPSTFSGLSGIGDLIVTCTSMHSRNRRAGILLGQGKTLEEALAEVHMVVEGVDAAKAIYGLSKEYGVEMPITEQVYSLLFEGKKPADTVSDLMLREKTSEAFDDYSFRA